MRWCLPFRRIQKDIAKCLSKKLWIVEYKFCHLIKYVCTTFLFNGYKCLCFTPGCQAPSPVLVFHSQLREADAPPPPQWCDRGDDRLQSALEGLRATLGVRSPPSVCVRVEVCRWFSSHFATSHFADEHWIPPPSLESLGWSKKQQRSNRKQSGVKMDTANPVPKVGPHGKANMWSIIHCPTKIKFGSSLKNAPMPPPPPSAHPLVCLHDFAVVPRRASQWSFSCDLDASGFFSQHNYSSILRLIIQKYFLALGPKLVKRKKNLRVWWQCFFSEAKYSGLFKRKNPKGLLVWPMGERVREIIGPAVPRPSAGREHRLHSGLSRCASFLNRKWMDGGKIH